MKKFFVFAILTLVIVSCKKEEIKPIDPVDNTTVNYDLLNGTSSKYWFQDSLQINGVTYSSLSYPWAQYTTQEVWIFDVLQNDFDINYGDTTPDPSYTYSLSDLGSVISFSPKGSSPIMSSYKIISLTETKLIIKSLDNNTVRYFHKQ